MEENSIYKQFQKLTTAIGHQDAFNVIDLPNMFHKLGVSNEGFPMFFVVTNDTPFITQNIERKFLSVEYDMPCTVIENGESNQNNHYSIITLRALDSSLQSYFINIFIMMLHKIAENPSKRELSIEVENLITIFLALSQPPQKKVQGLWAELLVIEQSLHPETLITAWHGQPDAKYDFTMGRDKIEVKSTSGEERIHHFALDQLNPSPNSRLLIASVIVRESAHSSSGLSVLDLFDRICTRVTSNNVRLRLYSIMAETIGNDIGKLNSIYFDYTEASDTLAFYDAVDVPHIGKDTIPPFISDVKFASNLTHLIDIKNSESPFILSGSPLFKSLF